MADDTGVWIQSTWQEMLRIISARGWRSAEQELYRRLRLAGTGIQPYVSQAQAITLVLATLQQKFGALRQSSQTLAKVVRTEETAPLADVIASRISAQGGSFRRAFQMNSELLASLGGLDGVLAERDTLRGPIAILGSTPSVAWRAALVAGLAGEPRRSKYWFDAHREMARSLHSSQFANNQVFRSTVALTQDTVPVDVIHEACGMALEGYLRDGLTTSGVLFINIAKSVVLPMIIESALLIQIGQLHDGVLQALLVRRLLRYEQISSNAEGIGELKVALARLDSSLPHDIIAHSAQSDDAFIGWLKRRVGETVAVSALVESERRFSEFQQSGNYVELMIVDDVFPSVVRGPRSKTVLFVWAGSQLCGDDISSFLTHGMGVSAIDHRVPSGDRSRTSVLRRQDIDRSSASLIHLDPGAAYEIGFIRGIVVPERIVYLRTDGPEFLTDLAAVLISEEAPGAAFYRIRNALEPVLGLVPFFGAG